MSLKKEQIRMLQNKSHELLHSFVNGGFSAIGFIGFPLVTQVSKRNMQLAREIHKKAKSLPGYRSKKIQGSGSLFCAQVLSEVYQALEKQTKVFKTVKRSVRIQNFENKHYSKDKYLRPIQQLNHYVQKNLSSFLYGFYLHGSLATRDYIKGWSDCDTLSIVSKDTLKSPKKILELRRRLYKSRQFFYRMDPLQHHGSIVISEYDLDMYCGSYFPLEILTYAKAMGSSTLTLAFKERSSKEETKKRLKWFVDYFNKLDEKKVGRYSTYDTKNLLHFIALFPSLYLQARGKPVYKKQSFGLAKKTLKKHWWPIEEMSRIRKVWPYKPSLQLHWAKINPVLPYTIQSYYHKILGDSIEVDASRLVKETKKLAKEAWQNV